MAKRRILYFITDSVPTPEQLADAETYGSGVVFRHALFVPEGDHPVEQADGVAGTFRRCTSKLTVTGAIPGATSARLATWRCTAAITLGEDGRETYGGSSRQVAKSAAQPQGHSAGGIAAGRLYIAGATHAGAGVANQSSGLWRGLGASTVAAK